MGFVEDMLESFSAKDLRSRVRWVIALGVLLCAAVTAGMYAVLIPPERISIEGTGRWEVSAAPVLSVSIDEGDIKKLASLPEIDVDLLHPPSGYVRARCPVLSLTPSPATVRLDGAAVPEELRAQQRIDLRLILMDMPLWEMLWGRRGG